MRKLFAVFAALALCGCAAAQNPGMTPRWFPRCYAPISQARDVSALPGAARGAGQGLAMGTLAGLAGGGVSALFTGNPLDIVSGAAIGAAGGTVAGGVQGAIQGDETRKQALVQAWSQEAGKPLYGLPFAQAAGTASVLCYDSAWAAVAEALREGAISRDSADSRFAEIERGRAEAMQLMGGAGN